MKRLNPETNMPFKIGEYNPENGLYFRSYQKTIIVNGYYKESWLSLDAFNRFKIKQKAAARVSSLKKLKRNKEIVDAYKLNSGCIVCGYNENPVALDFDHRIQSEKLFDISSRLANIREETLINEISKCDVLCANCHRIKIFNLNQHMRINGDFSLNQGVIEDRMSKSINGTRSDLYTSKTKSKMKNVYLSRNGIFYVRKQCGKDRSCLGSFDNPFDAACVAIKSLQDNEESAYIQDKIKQIESKVVDDKTLDWIENLEKNT